ncbi:ATP-binding protein [Streptomyces sp. NPDC003299]
MWTSVGAPEPPPAPGEPGPPPLLGRTAEAARLRALLTAHRLVTVTGTAGLGKSRLAATAVAGTPDPPWRHTLTVRVQGSGPSAPGTLTAALVRALTREAAAPLDDPEAATDAVAEPVTPPPGTPLAGPAAATVPGVAPVPEAEAFPEGFAVPEDAALLEGAAVPEAAAVPEGITAAGTGALPEGAAVPEPAATPDPAAVPGPAPDPATVPDVVAVLPEAPLLLLLDDVDPAHGECTRLVQHLLMAAPTLRVLVTSRRALGLGDEHVLRLGPLRTESRAGALSPAVRLFLDRARRAAPEFDPTDADLAAVAAICRHLEGNPLAIELAAAQAARHPLRRLAALTSRRQGWLADTHAALRRHRSVRAAVGADYVLCDRDLRRVWDRAGVFAGSFAESTAVFLCAGGGVEPDRVPSCLARLAAAGILTPVTDPGGVVPVRYRMTRAAREFGAERLREAGEYPVAAERRMSHCRRVAVVAADLWHHGSQSQAVRLVQDEHADLTAAVRHALTEPGHAQAALETVTDLWFWWAVHDGAAEGGDHLLRLLPLCDDGGPLPARALWLAAWLRAGTNPQQAGELLGRAWPAAVRAGDDATVGRIAHVQGLLAVRRHDPRAAAEHFAEAAQSIPPGAPGGPSASVALSALALAQTAFAPAAARRSARRALSRPETRDDPWACLVARWARAVVDHHQGRTARAWHRGRRALADLDGQPSPLGAAALRRLIGEIEAGRPAGPRPFVPRPAGEGREHRPNGVDMTRPAAQMRAPYRHMM